MVLTNGRLGPFMKVNGQIIRLKGWGKLPGLMEGIIEVNGEPMWWKDLGYIVCRKGDSIWGSSRIIIGMESGYRSLVMEEEFSGHGKEAVRMVLEHLLISIKILYNLRQEFGKMESWLNGLMRVQMIINQYFLRNQNILMKKYK